MCGIFGVVTRPGGTLSTKSTLRLLNKLFLLSESRGKEASGLVVFETNSNRIRYIRSPQAASVLLKNPAARAIIAQGLAAASGQSALAILGHSRLVTNGNQGDTANNQPVVRDNVAVVHNGIIVNIEDLWAKHSTLQRLATVDTEFIPATLGGPEQSHASTESSIASLFAEIEGTASIGTILAQRHEFFFGTNNGSLYWLKGRHDSNPVYIFASEKLFLSHLQLSLDSLFGIGSAPIRHVPAGSGHLIDLDSLESRELTFGSQSPSANAPSATRNVQVTVEDRSLQALSPIRYSQVASFVRRPEEESLLEDNRQAVARLRRCTRCILPETFPFIAFDAEGVCNYCRNHRPKPLGKPEDLEGLVSSARSMPKDQPNCLVSFSGGRDSSYALHYIKRELGLNPIAYTYDWGMVTDLARRNQARMCGKLGVEHILVSANIQRKRENIRKNVVAWLKKPDLGTIPLFMAGDKQFFYYANKVGQGNNLPLIFLSENPYERTDFKSGFCGIAPPQDSTKHIYSLSFASKMKMAFYYSSRFATNLGYLNRSLIDSFAAFLSYYFIPHNNINIFNYVLFDEPLVDRLLIGEYNWETAPDTSTTWRIGDGTAAFYNYIYYTVAGFSENETFRSNQIRAGLIDRDQALRLSYSENKPRYEAIRWYLDTIDLEFSPTIRAINAIAKRYNPTAQP